MLAQARQAVQAIGRTETKTVRLIGNDGARFDSFEISGSKDYPTVVIWGVDTQERVFIHEKKGEYRQVSQHMHAPMAHFRDFSGR